MARRIHNVDLDELLLIEAYEHIAGLMAVDDFRVWLATNPSIDLIVPLAMQAGLQVPARELMAAGYLPTTFHIIGTDGC